MRLVAKKELLFERHAALKNLIRNSGLDNPRSGSNQCFVTIKDSRLHGMKSMRIFKKKGINFIILLYTTSPLELRERNK